MDERVPPNSLPIPCCSSCKAPIAWLKTKAGKNMPVDAATATVGDLVFDPARHRPHWASCPNVARHRRDRPAKPQPEAAQGQLL